MRGDDEQQSEMFSYLTLEERVPQDHPLRAIRKLVDEVLRTMARDFDGLYAKNNAAFEVVEECQFPANRNIRADQLIRLTGARAQADYPELLRRIVVWDADNEREIVLLTNLGLEASWDSSLFFDSTTALVNM